jgi:hypothetical protein
MRTHARSKQRFRGNFAAAAQCKRHRQMKGPSADDHSWSLIFQAMSANGWLAAGPEGLVSNSEDGHFTTIVADFARMIDESHCITGEWSSIRPGDPQLNEMIYGAPVDLRCVIGRAVGVSRSKYTGRHAHASIPTGKCYRSNY